MTFFIPRRNQDFWFFSPGHNFRQIFPVVENGLASLLGIRKKSGLIFSFFLWSILVFTFLQGSLSSHPSISGRKCVMIPQRRIYDPSCSIVYGTWNVEQRARLNDRQAGRKSDGDAQESGEGRLEDDDDDQLFRIAFLFRLAVLLVSFANVFSPEDAVFQKAPLRREIR